MNEDIVQEILHELFSSLEALETKSAAILQLLKEKGLATEQELALQLEQAGNASNVRWRGVRVRIDHLVSSAVKASEQDGKQQAPKQESPKPQENSQESSTNTGDQTSRTSEGEKEGRNAQQVAPSRQSQGNDVDTTAEKDQSEPATENEDHGSGENAKKNAA